MSNKRERADSESDHNVKSETENYSTHITKKKKPPFVRSVPWPNEDLIELTVKIENCIPETDENSYETRLQKIDWEDVSFKTHSVKECKDVWNLLIQKVRKFRLLKEILNDVRAVLQHPRNSKTIKHPSKPKRPKTVFAIFIHKNRLRIKNENPTLAPKEILKKCSQEFKGLSQAERQVYEKEAEVCKEQYREQLNEFYVNHPEFIPKYKLQSKKHKEVVIEGGPPLKPKTSYELFFDEESKRNENSVKKEFKQDCREKWHNMSEKEKYFWINWSEEQYEKYLEDIKDYLKIHPQYEPTNIKPTLTKNEQLIKYRVLGKPKRPPQTAFSVFHNMIYKTEEFCHMQMKDCLRYTSEKWKTCPDEEKAEYQTRLNQMWEDYYVKLDHYLLTLPPQQRDKVRQECTWKRRKKNQKKTGKTKDTTLKRKRKVKKPASPPLTDYEYFLSVYNGTKNPVDAWENLDKTEKDAYAETLAEQRRKYIGAYERYLKSLTKEELLQLSKSTSNTFDTSSESSSSDSD